MSTAKVLREILEIAQQGTSTFPQAFEEFEQIAHKAQALLIKNQGAGKKAYQANLPVNRLRRDINNSKQAIKKRFPLRHQGNNRRLIQNHLRKIRRIRAEISTLTEK